MKNAMDSRYTYLKKAHDLLITNSLVVCLMFLLDYLPIFSYLLLSVSKVLQREGKFEESNDNFFYLSFYSYYKNYNGVFQPLYIRIFLWVSFSYFIFTYVLRIVMKRWFKKGKFCTLLIRILINFNEYVYFRILLVYNIDGIVEAIVYYSTVRSESEGSSSSTVAYLLIFGYLVLLLIILFGIVSHVYMTSIWGNIRIFSKNSFPFEMNHSFKFETVVLVLKLFMLLEKNILIVENFTLTTKSMCMNYFSLLVFFCYFFYLFTNVFLMKDKFLYYPLYPSSIFRLFLVLFTGAGIFFRFFFSTKYDSIFYVFFSLIFLMLAIYLRIFFKSHMSKRFVHSNDLIGILFFLSSNDVSTNKCIANWILRHKLSCPKECEICSRMKKDFSDLTVQKVELKKFFHFLIEIIKERFKKNTLEMTRENQIYFNALEIIDMFLQEQHQKLIFNVKLYKKLLKYQKTNVNFYFNLYMIFEKVREMNKMFIASYESFNQINLIRDQFKNFLDKVDNFMRCYTKNSKLIFEISDEVSRFVHNEELKTFLRKNTINFSYENFLLRFVYETIIHHPINKGYDAFDIKQYYDVLNFHFMNDNLIQINYTFINNDFQILKSSFLFRQQEKKSIDILFPKYIQKEGKKLLTNQIKENNFDDPANVFTFVINNVNDSSGQGFIENFVMNYMMFPSIEEGNVLLDGKFTYKEDDVLIAKKVANSHTFTEILYSFSERLKDFFGVTPAVIQKLQKKDRVFFLDNFLYRADSASSTAGNPTKKIEENFHFALRVKKFTQSLIGNLREILQTDEMSIRKCCESLKACENGHFALRILKRTEIGSKDSAYVIFTVKMERVNKMNKTIFETKAYQNDVEVTNDFFEMQTVNQYATQIGTESSFSASSESNSIFFSSKKKKGKESRDIGLSIRSVSFHLKFTFVAGIVLLIICTTILGLQYNRAISFSNYFNLFQKFHFLKRGIDIEMLRLNANYCYQTNPDNNEGPCTCFFKEYSKTIKLNASAPYSSFLLNEITYQEFKSNFNTIKGEYSKYLAEAYKVAKNEDNEIFNSTVQLAYLVEEDSKSSLLLKNESASFALNFYFNLISQIIDEDKFTSTPIRFFKLDTDYEITDLGTITDIQKNIYQLLLNYPKIQQDLVKTQGRVFDWVYRIVDRISEIYYIFILVILIKDILVVFEKIRFVYQIREILQENINTIDKKINNQDFITYFQSKFQSLKFLVSLYEKKPGETIQKMYKERERYSHQQRELAMKLKQMESQSSSEKVEEKKKKKNAPSGFKKDNYIKFYYLRVLEGFLTYGLIYIVLAIAIVIRYEEIKSVSTFTDYQSQIDNYLSMNLNGLQIMGMANLTQQDLGFFFTGERTQFITEGIFTHLYLIKKTKLFESKHTKLFSDFNDTISCDDLPSIADETFKSIIPEGEEQTYNDYLVAVCEAFPIMKFESQNLVMENIIYLEEKILDNMKIMTYRERYYVASNEVIFELYSIVMVIYRMFRSFINQSQLPRLIDRVISVYKLDIIICLTANLILQISSVFLITYFVEYQLLKINNTLRVFLRFLG